MVVYTQHGSFEVTITYLGVVVPPWIVKEEKGQKGIIAQKRRKNGTSVLVVH